MSRKRPLDEPPKMSSEDHEAADAAFERLVAEVVDEPEEEPILSGEAAEEADETPTVIGETTPYVGAPSIQNQTIFRTWPLPPGRFELIKVLGIGGVSTVACVHDNVTGTKRAIKRIKDQLLRPFENAHRLFREIEILRQLNHPNVVKLVALVPPRRLPVTNRSEICMVFEALDTDLFKIGKSKAHVLGEKHVRKIMYEFLKALKYIHSAGIIHRDIKPANIFVTLNCDVALGDFGLARSVLDPVGAVGVPAEPPVLFPTLTGKYVVTRGYRAPELPLYGDGHYTFALDMWSAGCVLGELLKMMDPDREIPLTLFPVSRFIPDCTTVPENPTEKHAELESIFRVMGTPTPDELGRVRTPEAQAHLALYDAAPSADFAAMFPHANVDAIHLLKQLLAFCPEDRITAEAALAHPWFAGVRQPDTETVASAPVVFEDVTSATIFPRLQEVMGTMNLCSE